MGQRKMGRAPSEMVPMIKAAGWGIGWTILWAAIVAWLIDEGKFHVESVGYCSLVAWLGAGWITSAMAGRMQKEKRTAAGLCALGIYILFLSVMNLLLLGGQFPSLGLTLALLFAGWGVSLLTLGKGRGRSGARRYKIPK